MDDEEIDTDFISELKRKTKKMIEMQKRDFCKYLIDCPVKDTDCFDPYKTKGCHMYREFEGL